MTKDYTKRDEMIFKNNNSTYEIGGVRWFEEIDVDTAKQLIKEGFLDPNDRQNDSPTAAKFIKFCEKYPQVKMHGYVVSPGRSDTRVTIEGLVCKKDINNDLRTDFEIEFSNADDLDCNTTSLYCWWD